MTAPGLRAELRAIDERHPAWHSFVSDAGRLWASTTRCDEGGSGTTVDAGSPGMLEHEIAAVERTFDLHRPWS
jgi:hypothetical protein